VVQISKYILSALAIVALLPLNAQEVDSVNVDLSRGLETNETGLTADSYGYLLMGRVARSVSATENLLNEAWNNPAIMQFKRDYSISEVKVGYNSRSENDAVDVQLGNKDYTLLFDATTYMKHRNSTLWGEAYYNNGRIRGVNWNETSEPQMVMPYLLADSVGGKMNLERYSFMGGYSSHNDRWAWGASIGYTAGLYYRNVDPRPRNVTANLDVKAGAGYKVWRDYVLAASLHYRKYKQTNNVAFYSELGNDKIFHLIGFAYDYNRFAGTGIQTYYNGNRLGATLNFNPSTGYGFSASVDVSRFAFNNIITQLNKLPMARVTQNEIVAEAGWLSQAGLMEISWGVKADVKASRRVGTENIFGDPAGSVYTQIGKLDMFFQNCFETSVSGTWEKRWGYVQRYVGLAACPQIAYSHINEIYVDPAGCRQINEMHYGMRIKVTVMPNWRTHLALNIVLNHVAPTSSNLDIDSNSVKSELAGLERALRSNFNYLSSKRTSFLAGLDVTVAVTAKYAIHTSAQLQHTNFVLSTHRDEFNLSLGFLF